MSKVLVICCREDTSKLKRYCDDVMQWKPITIGQIPKVNMPTLLGENRNKWRGGSRGKGGKTKWPRR